MDNKIVQSLWIGDRLSVMERMCINSFIQNGHEFHLYIYDQVENVPNNAIIKDANDIIPRNQIFKIRDGFSSFSDFFRWKLILDKGGWWTDTDAVLLKPLDFNDDYVFIGGFGLRGSSDCVSSGLFKCPQNSEIMQWCWNQSQKIDTAKMSWGEAGPPLITDAVHFFNMQNFIVPGRLFFPIFYTDAPEAFIKNENIYYSQDIYSVHLFNEIWRLKNQDKNADYPSKSFYEICKRRFN